MRRTLAALILSASALFGQAGNSGYGTGGGGGTGTYTFQAPLSLVGSSVSLGASGVTSGPYTCMNATVNTQGIITTATSGTCTGGTGTVTHTVGALTLNQLVFGNGAADIAVGNLTGDITTSGGKATTLATVNANVGSFGSSSLVPVITVNAKGLITAVTTSAVTGGAGTWGSITGTLSSQTDLQTALNAKQNTITLLPVANGGTGTATPGLVAGTNVTVSGTWPNQTVNSSGGTGGNIIVSSLPGTCSQGSTYFLTTGGTPNQRLYNCDTNNTLIPQFLPGPTGALGVNSSTGALDIVTSVVPRLNVANPFTGRNGFAVNDFTLQAAPAAAPAGKISLYANSDGSFHMINAAGTDSALATGAGFANPMTTQDDVIVGGASGVASRLAKGADSQVLGIDPATHHVAYINQTGGTGSGTPCTASAGTIQFNNAGSFGCDSAYYYDAATWGTHLENTGNNAIWMWNKSDASGAGDYIVMQSGSTPTRKYVLALNNDANGGILPGALDIRDEVTGTAIERLVIMPGGNNGKVLIGGDGSNGGGLTTDQALVTFGAVVDKDGVRINSPNQSSTCSVSTRGLFRFIKGASGVADSVQVCAKNASDAYAFVTVF